jgi:membrane-bound serine protease (ClpP class)
MLVEGPIPELRVPPSMLVPLVVTVTAVCAFVVRLAVRAQRGRVASGREGLFGEIGTVSEDLSPAGKVFVHGEIWNAVAEGGAMPRGTRVRVVNVDGMTLTVASAGESRPVREPPPG